MLLLEETINQQVFGLTKKIPNVLWSATQSVHSPTYETTGKDTGTDKPHAKYSPEGQSSGPESTNGHMYPGGQIVHVSAVGSRLYVPGGHNSGALLSFIQK